MPSVATAALIPCCTGLRWRELRLGDRSIIDTGTSQAACINQAGSSRSAVVGRAGCRIRVRCGRWRACQLVDQHGCRNVVMAWARSRSGCSAQGWPISRQLIAKLVDIVILDADADQLAVNFKRLGHAIARLAAKVRLNDLMLELHAVRSMLHWPPQKTNFAAIIQVRLCGLMASCQSWSTS